MTRLQFAAAFAAASGYRLPRVPAAACREVESVELTHGAAYLVMPSGCRSLVCDVSYKSASACAAMHT